MLLTSELKLNKWEIYHLEVEISYRTQIPGYESYNENTKSFKVVHKYTESSTIQDEVFEKVEKEIGIKYSGTPRIINIKILNRLGYGIAEKL